jgi:hypothetical protein
LPSILTFVSIQATLKRTMPIEVSSIGIGLLMRDPSNHSGDESVEPFI